MENELITLSDESMTSLLKRCDRAENTLSKLSVRAIPLLKGERYLTDRELSHRLKIGRRTLQEYRNEGKIPFIRLGGKVLYPESEIEKFLNNGYRRAFEL